MGLYTKRGKQWGTGGRRDNRAPDSLTVSLVHHFTSGRVEEVSFEYKRVQEFFFRVSFMAEQAFMLLVCFMDAEIPVVTSQRNRKPLLPVASGETH